jgi:hypothetical protein
MSCFCHVYVFHTGRQHAIATVHIARLHVLAPRNVVKTTPFESTTPPIPAQTIITSSAYVQQVHIMQDQHTHPLARSNSQAQVKKLTNPTMSKQNSIIPFPSLYTCTQDQQKVIIIIR